MNRIKPVFWGLGWFLFVFAFRQSEPKQELSISQDPRLFSATWFGLSAENQACYRQAYRMADFSLDRILASNQNAKLPMAIITDLDETILDNSAWAFKVLMKGTDYPGDWENWEKAGIAPAFPGAVSFFQKAASKKIEVFYVSNRMQENVEFTLKNLKKLGLPYSDSNHILLKTTESNKVARRKKISENYQIVMLLGDNLADFDGVWEHSTPDAREKAVSDHGADWGNRFIIFPNPVYGGWKDALFLNKRNWSKIQQDSIWNYHLQTYRNKIGF